MDVFKKKKLKKTHQAFCKLKQFELGRCDSDSFPSKHQGALK